MTVAGGWVDPAEDETFRAFVAHRSAALLRTAHLLVDRPDRAEDLVQTALVKTYLAWPRIRDPAAVEGYARRVMATTAISWWRGRRYREQPHSQPPESSGPDGVDAWANRDEMWERLRRLPARQRAVLVLRYYEDLSEAEIAQTLAISRGAVKSHAARALAALRVQIADENAGVVTP
jgi:RNA polymerase sigma-70 factor (sigma-E family)